MATYPRSNHYYPATAQWVNSSTPYTVTGNTVSHTGTGYAGVSTATATTMDSAAFRNLQGQYSRLANATQRAADKMKPKPPGYFDGIKAAFEKVKGGPMKPVRTEPHLKKDGRPLMVAGLPLVPIGGAAPDAEVDYEVIDETPPPPTPPPPHRKKVVMKRTVGIKRDKGAPSLSETHAGKVTFVRQMEGPDHLTENIGIRAEPSGTTNHIEIPKKMLLKALVELSRDDEDILKELKRQL